MEGSERKAWTFSTSLERTCKLARQPSRRNQSPSEAPSVSDLLDFWPDLPRLHCARGSSGGLHLVDGQEPTTTVKEKPSLHFHVLGRP